VTVAPHDEQVNQVAAQWRDALARVARAASGSPERRRAAADAARYEASYGIALTLAPIAESFAASLLRQRREAMTRTTLTPVATRRPAR